MEKIMKPDFDELNEFREKLFGWITPENRIISCEVMSHISVLPEKYLDRYRELIDRYTDDMHETLADEQSNLKDDDYYHPAMHRFDPTGFAASDIFNDIKSDGWLRIGYYKPKTSDIDGVLEVHGSQSRSRELEEYLKFIVDVFRLKKYVLYK